MSLSCWHLIKFSYEALGNGEEAQSAERSTYGTYVRCIHTCYLLVVNTDQFHIGLPFPSHPFIHSIGKTVTIEISIERFRYIRWLFDAHGDWRPICLRVAHFISLVCHRRLSCMNVTWPHRVSVRWSIKAGLRLSPSSQRITDKEDTRKNLAVYKILRGIILFIHAPRYSLYMEIICYTISFHLKFNIFFKLNFFYHFRRPVEMRWFILYRYYVDIHKLTLLLN